MTAKQRTVAALLFAGLPAAEAVRRAGYNNRDPGRVIDSDGVQQELRRLAETPMAVTTESVTIPRAILEDAGGRIISGPDLDDAHAALLTRGWVISRMMLAAQMALGEVQMVRQVEKHVQRRAGADKAPVVDEAGQPVFDVHHERRLIRQPNPRDAGNLLRELLAEAVRIDDANRKAGFLPGRHPDDDGSRLIEGDPMDIGALTAELRARLEAEDEEEHDRDVGEG